MKRFFCVALAVMLMSGYSYAQPSRKRAQVIAQVAKYKNADPIADLQRAWSKGDLRFIGIYGYSLNTPGVPRRNDKGFVHLVGINPVKGTSDAIMFPEVSQLNEVAHHYATKYNSLLFQKLQTSKKTNPVIVRLFKQIEQELRVLERSDASTDFRRNVKKKDYRFIYLYDTGLEGVYDKNFDELKLPQLPLKELKGNKDLMTKGQYQRLRRVAVRYVKPYNQMMFKFLKSRVGSK